MPGEIEKLDYRIDDWAGRERAWEWIGYDQLLPDPDQVMLRKGYSTYEWIGVLRFLLTDPHVWACYQSRRSGTLSHEWEITQGKGSGAAKAYKLIQSWADSRDLYQIIGDILMAPFLGMQPLEVIWQSGNGQWLPDRVVARPAEWFAFDLDNQVRFLSKANMMQGELPPDYKILLPQHNASYENPYGERILSRCYWPVIWKRSAQKFWAIFAEKYGMPFLVGKVPKGTNEAERAAILAKLAAMIQDAVAVLNDDESVDFKSDAFKASSEGIYAGLVDKADTQISKAILGQTLTTEPGESGSYSLGQVHADVREDLLEQDRRLVESTMNQLFRWIVEINFGQSTAAPRWGWFQEEDVQKDRADRDDVLSKQGVRFSKGYYQRTYNLEDGDFEVGKAELENAADQANHPWPKLTDKAASDWAKAVTDREREFAEAKPVENPAEVVDLITNKALQETSLGDMIDPIKKLLDQVDSLEEYRDRLLDAYGDMNTNKLGTLMQKALTLADLAGKFDGRR